MMRHLLTAMLCAACWWPPASTYAGDMARIRLSISAIPDPDAPLIVLLFRESGWLHPDKAVHRLELNMRNSGKTSGLLRDIPYPDRYAIEVFQDINGNGKLDMHWFPIPGPDEPVGFSRGYVPSGRPSFDKAAFILDSGEQHIAIRLR